MMNKFMIFLFIRQISSPVFKFSSRLIHVSLKFLKYSNSTFQNLLFFFFFLKKTLQEAQQCNLLT
jgi:hypothetical protein